MTDERGNWKGDVLFSERNRGSFISDALIIVGWSE